MSEQDGPQGPPEPVRIRHDGAVTRVQLSQPRRMNPQSPQVWEQLARAARELPAATRVVVLGGDARARGRRAGGRGERGAVG